MPGVVSIPHGWGHDVAGIEMAVAATHAGRQQQRAHRRLVVDPLSGNAVLNGIPVEVAPATKTAPSRGAAFGVKEKEKVLRD